MTIEGNITGYFRKYYYYEYAKVYYILFQEHSGRVFRLQFDEFQIVSSSHDDSVLVWDFLNVPVAEASSRSPSRTYTYVSK